MHRSNTIWPEVGPDARIVSFDGPWPQLEQLAWTLIERQNEPLYAARYPDGSGALALRIDASWVRNTYDLARRAGTPAAPLHTRIAPGHLSVSGVLSPLRLEQLVLDDLAPQAQGTPFTSTLHPTTLHLYVALDVPAGPLPGRLAALELSAAVYRLARCQAVYFYGWAELARMLRAHGSYVRPAYGFPHGYGPSTLSRRRAGA